jgi:FkbM family methyltransferase
MRSDLPILIRGAFFWNKHGLRAKAAVPRFVGRHFAGNQSVFIETASGAKLSVVFNNLDTYAAIYNLGGTWDPHVMRVCQALMRDRDVFYDIGSNTGIFAIDSGFKFKTIKGYAFEPQADQADAIQQSIIANGLLNIFCIKCMLGESDGTSQLYLTSHSIHASSIPREGKFRKVEVSMRTIDSLSRDGILDDPDVVKIDVEGGEMAVFRGARETFSRSAPSMVFEADENLHRFGIEPNALLEMIASFGEYRFFEIDKRGALNSISRIENEGNFLALSARHKPPRNLLP